MRNKESRIERQAKYRIRSLNRQRSVLAAFFIVFIGMLIFFDASGAGTLPVRFSAFCSAAFLLCGAAFVLTPPQAALLLLAAEGPAAASLCLGHIGVRLFLMLSFINAGAFFISHITDTAIVRSAAGEIEKIDRLKTEAATDGLTHLLNRNGMERAAAVAWAFCKRDKKNACIILVDIDHFKRYNDTFGHPEGDNILKRVADSIKTCFRRETDIICRIGGDEFLILLTDMGGDRVLEMVQSLSSAIMSLGVKTASPDSPCDFLSVSIGVATGAPQMDDSLEEFYREADNALYRAKKAGRNCISFNERIIRIGAPGRK